MTRDERQAYLQRLMSTLTGEGTPTIITEAGEVLEGQDLPPFEKVAYALDLFPWVNDHLAALVVQTVRLLPEEVREFVYESCLFISGTSRTLFLPPLRETWLIILPDSYEPNESDAHSLIAHEIATIYLRRDTPEADWTMADAVQAAGQVREWGFTGNGADVDFHQREAERFGPKTIIV